VILWQKVNSMGEIISNALFHTIALGFLCYKLKSLELDKRKNLILELTQENLIENSV